MAEAEQWIIDPANWDDQWSIAFPETGPVAALVAAYIQVQVTYVQLGMDCTQVPPLTKPLDQTVYGLQSMRELPRGGGCEPIDPITRPNLLKRLALQTENLRAATAGVLNVPK